MLNQTILDQSASVFKQNPQKDVKEEVTGEKTVNVKEDVKEEVKEEGRKYLRGSIFNMISLLNQWFYYMLPHYFLKAYAAAYFQSKSSSISWLAVYANISNGTFVSLYYSFLTGIIANIACLAIKKWILRPTKKEMKQKLCYILGVTGVTDILVLCCLHYYGSVVSSSLNLAGSNMLYTLFKHICDYSGLMYVNVVKDYHYKKIAALFIMSPFRTMTLFTVLKLNFNLYAALLDTVLIHVIGWITKANIEKAKKEEAKKEEAKKEGAITLGNSTHIIQCSLQSGICHNTLLWILMYLFASVFNVWIYFQKINTVLLRDPRIQLCTVFGLSHMTSIIYKYIFFSALCLYSVYHIVTYYLEDSMIPVFHTVGLVQELILIFRTIKRGLMPEKSLTESAKKTTDVCWKIVLLIYLNSQHALYSNLVTDFFNKNRMRTQIYNSNYMNIEHNTMIQTNVIKIIAMVFTNIILYVCKNLDSKNPSRKYYYYVQKILLGMVLYSNIVPVTLAYFGFWRPASVVVYMETLRFTARIMVFKEILKSYSGMEIWEIVAGSEILGDFMTFFSPLSGSIRGAWISCILITILNHFTYHNLFKGHPLISYRKVGAPSEAKKLQEEQKEKILEITKIYRAFSENNVGGPQMDPKGLVDPEPTTIKILDPLIEGPETTLIKTKDIEKHTFTLVES